MRTIRIAALAAFVIWAGSQAMRGDVDGTNVALAQTPASSPAATPPRVNASAVVDTFAAERDSMMNALLKSIAGKENVAAESVFKNIKVLKGFPAGRVLRVMNIGYGRSLGVRCAHCHDTDKWESEDKPQKQITRDMWAMMGTINGEMLPKIKNLRSEKPGINCTTCHRGSIKPAQNL